MLLEFPIKTTGFPRVNFLSTLPTGFPAFLLMSNGKRQKYYKTSRKSTR